MDFNELSYIITGACYEVSHQLGCGFLEKVYEAALVKELSLRGLEPKQEVQIPIYYKNERLDINYRADLIVNNEVLIELKVVSELDDIHKAQVLNYLRATNIRYGMLINFGKPRIEIQRLIMDK